MTEIAAAGPRESPVAALFRHSRHVLTQNPITAFAFALFLLILLAAVFGPYIVPYDPLASDTTQALKPPNAQPRRADYSLRFATPATFWAKTP